MPQFTLSPETLTLGLQAERALGAAGCPRSQDGALAAPGGTEANAGGRGLPSPSCLETKQTLLSCPPAPGILLRTRPFRSVTLGRSGEEIELSKRWWGEGGRGAPETPVAEDGGARTAESPRGGGRSPATPRAHGRCWMSGCHAHPPTLPVICPPQTGLSAVLSRAQSTLCSPGVVSHLEHVTWEVVQAETGRFPKEPGRLMDGSWRPMGPLRREVGKPQPLSSSHPQCLAKGQPLPQPQFAHLCNRPPGGVAGSGRWGQCTVRAGSQAILGQVAARSPLPALPATCPALGQRPRIHHEKLWSPS